MESSKVPEYDIVEEKVVQKSSKKDDKCSCTKETRDLNCKKHGG